MSILNKIGTNKVKSFPEKFVLQIKLLLWKRYQESTKSKWELLKVLLPAWIFFALLILLYEGFGFFAAGAIEPLVVPIAFWVFVQRIVVQIMHEKSSRLQESMRMMGLSDISYWVGYFLSDGVILGFIMSFSCALMSTGGLFNDANFGVVLGLLLVFCISAVPFAFFMTSFFDTPQTSGQATLALLIGFYVIYVSIFMVDNLTIPYKTAQIICCLFPPFALQLGCGSFLKSYAGIPTSSICGMMVADIFIYTTLAWYFSQVWPSKVSVARPWYFIFLRSYWFPGSGHNTVSPCLTQDIKIGVADCELLEEGNTITNDATTANSSIPSEKVNETLVGQPTVVVNKLKKTFGTQTVVNDLSFNMYENQIFALLGHNGAGKTTTISMLTGMISPDYSTDNHGASIYGSNILAEMDQVRMSMGICPQHDVLFEGLSVREHILFFAQLKGASYEDAQAEATNLTTMFHLEERMDHLGNELSGGQRRKLSVAIAVCGGSKFVVLDEPTAGMDPLARRELWDLLASLRKGRTMLLTTHYMDEADVLGDRVGIMSLGQMQCVGTTQFLKNTYGAGYKLIFDKKEKMTADQLAQLTDFVHRYIPEAKYLQEDGAEDQALYNLPFNTIAKFGPFFTELEKSFDTLHVSNFGVTITSLEDVFLKVGEDHTVTPEAVLNKEYGIGRDRTYHSNMTSQIIGICKRKLTYCYNDFVTVPLVGFPIAAAVAAAILDNMEIITRDKIINNMVVGAIYIGGYLGAPGLLAEFIVRERNDKLRNVLTVMGCDFRAYWIGTFLADFLIMMIPMVALFITWGAADMSNFYTGLSLNGTTGMPFLFGILFTIELITFSYFFSNAFSTPKACISYFPILLCMLLVTPNVILMICFQVARAVGTSMSEATRTGIYVWGELLVCPHGAFFTALMSSTADYSSYVESLPSMGACIAIMIVESILFFLATYYLDIQSVIQIEPIEVDPDFNPSVLENLDEDVSKERQRTAELTDIVPLKVNRLRKVFPPKAIGRRSVVATEDVAFMVEKGEIFGLLGANGAGKTTTLSMLTRHLVPTSGDALIANHSVLSNFRSASTHMGVVTQNNSLWDRLSVEDHLYLFARLRGVPEDLVDKVVDGTIDQLELTPHRHKLSMRLSGGMKRKLCVAIALIGDPEVVLLDEPSAGLDPVSRRNLWSVILRTMSHRAVILTTHSMDEAEALCKRIGIMVHGQLRALGTKQHLKNKFGSGFELEVKLHVTDLEQQINELNKFITNMFPSANIITENGGLITYEISSMEMKMGLVFTQLEANKSILSIENYSVAQPTLEQVFIRTVNKHTPIKKESLHSTNNNNNEEEIFQEINKCGCTRFTTQVFTGISIFCFLLFSIIGVFVYGRSDRGIASLFYIIGFIFLFSSILGCSLLCCACCRPATGADE